MDDIDLETISERNKRRRQIKAAATPGPWHVVQLDDEHAMSMVAVATQPDDGRSRRWPDFDASVLVSATLVQQPRYVDIADERWDENAAFIASARNDNVEDDVDTLLAEIDRLRQQLHP